MNALTILANISASTKNKTQKSQTEGVNKL